MGLTPDDKRFALLNRAHEIVMRQVDAGMIPDVNEVKIDWLADEINLGRTDVGTLKRLYGEPPCYLYVSNPRDHLPLIEGPDFEIYSSDKYTLTFYLRYIEDPDYENSSAATWKTVLYSDDPVTPGLIHSLRNDRVFPSDSNYPERGRVIVSLGATHEGKLTLAELKKIAVHYLEQVVTVEGDV